MNPELRRNLWLEITTHRLLAMPVILGLAFLALAAVDRPNAAEHVAWLGLGGFTVLSMFWGARLAGQSIIDEITDKTWDWQRLSTLGPWTMTWGKLFGATAFSWYGGIICLVVFLASPVAAKTGSPIKFGFALILMAIMMHAAIIAAALHVSRNSAAAHRRSIGVLPLLLLFYVVPFAMARAWGQKDSPSWYGLEIDGLNFLLASAAVFAAWAVIGAYRAMCQSLAVRTAPFVWLAFLIFVTAYAAGFGVASNGQNDDAASGRSLALAGWMTGVMGCYIMLFTEATGPVAVRRILQKIRLQQWQRALQELPCWPVAWLFALVSAMLLAASGAAGTGSDEGAFAPIPWTLLVARDIGIFLFFAAAAKPKRVVGTTLVYMLLLDWIVPGLLGAMGFAQLAGLVFPLVPGDFWAQCASALAQAALAVWLAWRRMQINFASYAST